MRGVAACAGRLWGARQRERMWYRAAGGTVCGGRGCAGALLMWAGAAPAGGVEAGLGLGDGRVPASAGGDWGVLMRSGCCRG